MIIKRAPIAAAILTICSSAAFAANDGTQNSTSTGTTDISFTVSDQVLLTGLGDVALGTYGATDTGDAGANEAFCVYRNGGDDFTITASNTADSATDFVLTGTTGDEIQYSVLLATGAAASASSTALTYNTASADLAGSNQRNCGGSDNTSIYIKVGEQEMREASTGSYSGTLQLLVSPS